MIEWLASYSPWLGMLVFAVPYLTKLSFVVKLLGVFGPFAAPLQAFLEGAAVVVSTVLTWFFNSIWFCVFHYLSWGAILAAYLAGSFFPAQNVRVKVTAKRPAIVQQHVATRKASKRASDAGSITRNQFQR
jgi:hypothetical protein